MELSGWQRTAHLTTAFGLVLFLNAMAIARYLSTHPKVAKVIYPGLPSHPQHELARRHSLSRNLIRLWVRKYEVGEFTDEVAEVVRIAEYERKIAELERKVGQLTMEVDLLKKGRLVGT